MTSYQRDLPDFDLHSIDPSGPCGRGAVKAVRDGCANLVAGRCVTRRDEVCRVLAGVRCEYSERVGLIDAMGRGIIQKPARKARKGR